MNYKNSAKRQNLVFGLAVLVATTFVSQSAHAGGFMDSINGFVNNVFNTADDVINTIGGIFNDLGLGWLFNDLIGLIFGTGTCGEQVTGGVGEVLCNVVLSTDMLPALISGIAYLMGMLLTVVALIKLKDHVSDPRSVPLSDSLKRFVAGGALFSLPMVSSAAYELLVGTGQNEIASYGQGRFSGQLSSSGGLDSMVYWLVADLWEPLQILIASFAYIAGLVFIVIGISRLLKTAQEGPSGPSGIGTIMTFVTAGVLFSLDRMMGAFSSSLFGRNVVRTYAILQQETGDNAVNGHVEAMISAVIGFMALIGWISFVRGFFILRDVAEGKGQASLMVASTHIIGGALAVNLGPLIMAVESTLGLTPYGVTFVL